jgi:hypothetical protein
MKEIYCIIGDKIKIISRVKHLMEQEQYQLALQILDIILQSEPEDIEALKLRIELVTNLAQNDICVMSKNAYYYSIKEDKLTIKRIKRKLRQ